MATCRISLINGYALPEEGSGAAFLIRFRQSAALLVCVFEDSAKYLQRRKVLTQTSKSRRRQHRFEREGFYRARRAGPKRC